MFNGKSFNEKLLFMRKYYDFMCAINCTQTYLRVCLQVPVRLIAHVSGNSMIMTD